MASSVHRPDPDAYPWADPAAAAAASGPDMGWKPTAGRWTRPGPRPAAPADAANADAHSDTDSQDHTHPDADP